MLLKEIENQAVIDLALFERSVVFHLEKIENFKDQPKNINTEEERDKKIDRLAVEIRELLRYIKNIRKKPEYPQFSIAFKQVVDEIWEQWKTLE